MANNVSLSSFVNLFLKSYPDIADGEMDGLGLKRSFEYSGERVMDLLHHVYISKATGKVDDEILDSIQKASSSFNPQNGITGMLLFGSGYFVQLLEGPQDAVLQLVDRISKDKRHGEIITVYSEPAASRLFSGWGMGVVNMDHHEQSFEIEKLWESIDLAQAINARDGSVFYRFFDTFATLSQTKNRSKETV